MARPVITTYQVNTNRAIVAGNAAGAVVPTTATLSGPQTVSGGVQVAYAVTLDKAADRAYTVTWGTNGAAAAPTSTIAVGQTMATVNISWAAAGSGTVDFTISPALTRAGNPIPVTIGTVATVLTLSVPSSGTTGTPVTVTVTTNNPIPVGGGTATLAASNGGTLGATTLTFTAGSSASQTTTLNRIADGTSTVTMTNSMGLANNGSGATYTSSSAISTGTPQPFTLTSASSGSLPFSIGFPLTQGHVPSGQSLTFSGATARFKVLSTWPDGSAKFGVVAGVYTSAGSAVTVTPTVGTVTEGAALTGAAVQTAMGANTAVIGCGAFGTATWSGADFASPFLTHSACDYFGEFIYRKAVGSDAHLTAWLAVRLWSTGQVEVLPWIENGYLNVASPTSKSATYTFSLGGSTRESLAIDLPNHCRTPLVSGSALSHWLGTDPAVTPTHNNPYLQATRLVPAYRATVGPTSAAVTSRPSTYTPLQQGDYNSTMGNPGYHPSIGLLPEWDVIYLTTTATSPWAALQRNAYSAGRYGIHYRDETTNRPLKFSSYPNLVVGGGNGMTGTGASTTSSYTPTATGTSPATFASTHHPSMGYMAYLLTGRFYHLETAQFLSTALFIKNGDGPRLGTQGVFDTTAGANTVRGAAWAIRSLAQAAAITPDADTLAAEFRNSLASNVNFYHGRYVAQPNNPQGFVQPYNDYTPPTVGGLTEAGSTATAIIFPSGYVYTTDGLYVGNEVVIGGQVRTVTAYVGATRTATVSPAFSVMVASQPFVIRSDNILYDATWQQDFFTQALGYALAMPANLGSTALGKLEDLFHWKAQSVVGRLGSKGLTEYLYRDAGAYNIAIAPDNFPDFAGGTGPWFKSWGEVYNANNALATLEGNPFGSRVDGDLRGTSGSTPTDPAGFWANMLPALSYAVEHKVAGAYAAYLGLTGATAWTTLSAGFDGSPVWGVKPPTEPTMPSWLPAAGTFKNVGLNRLLDVAPSGWPTNDIGGPFINWCMGFMNRDGSGFGETGTYGSGHLALATNPLWAGVNLFNWDTLLWRMSNVPAAPISDSTGYNFYGESTSPPTLGHLATPHTYGSLTVRPRAFGGGKRGSMRHNSFPGTPPTSNKTLHEFDLDSATAPPARKVDNMPFSGSVNNYIMAAADLYRRGDWCVPFNGNPPLCFVSWDTNTVTQFGGVGYNEYGDHSMQYIPSPWDCLVAGGHDGKRFVCPIVGNTPQGWTQIFPSGTYPSDDRAGGAWDGIDDSIVAYQEGSSTTVHRLRPPAPGGSLTTGWAWETVALTGAGGAIPSSPGTNPNNGLPYTTNGAWSKMQPVRITPSLQVWSWCDGVNSYMQAWRLS
jgi:hypothetical protein